MRRRKEVEVGGEGAERASLERLRAVDYYVTMETNLHFTSPDSFFFLAVHPTAMAGGELALESGSNKPVIKQNSESHYSPHVHLGGGLFINYYQSGGRASELSPPNANQHVVVLFLMSKMSLFTSNGDLDNMSTSSFLLKLRK